MIIKQHFSDKRLSINYPNLLSDKTMGEISSWVAVFNMEILYQECW